MISSAMNYALPLGLFWVFKYLFAIGGDYYEVSKYIYTVLGIGTPIIYYALLCRYRDVTLGGQITYPHSILFSLLLFLFASICEAVIISIHYLILNPAIVSNQIEMILKMYKNMQIPSVIYDQAKSTLHSYGSALFIGSTIFVNFIIGLFLSLPLGYFVSKPQRDNSQNL